MDRRLQYLAQNLQKGMIMVKHEFVFNIEELPIRPKWKEIFGKDAPVFLEIGIGNGEFISWIAKKYPENNYVGVEIVRKVLKKAANRVHRGNLLNVKLIYGEGARALSKLFAPGELAGLYLNFPDPWRKKAHKQRRLVREEFPWLLAEKLKRDGIFLMVTDWVEYAGETLEFFQNCPAFAPLWESPLRYELPDYYHTKYARKWLSRGFSLFYIGFKKVKEVEIPEEVYKLYPLAELEEEEPLPETILKTYKDVKFEELLEKWKRGVIYKDARVVVKIMDVYVKRDGALVDVLLSEGTLLQRFFVAITPHPQGIMISIHESNKPEPTRGVHTAISVFTKELLNMYQGSIFKSTCKNSILKKFTGAATDCEN